VDTRNLSASMNEEDLKKIFDEMSALVEYSFDVSVEEIYGAISFWTPTPEDEVERGGSQEDL